MSLCTSPSVRRVICNPDPYFASYLQRKILINVLLVQYILLSCILSDLRSFEI